MALSVSRHGAPGGRAHAAWPFRRPLWPVFCLALAAGPAPGAEYGSPAGPAAFPPHEELMALHRRTAGYIGQGRDGEPMVASLRSLYGRLRDAAPQGRLPAVPPAETNALAQALHAELERPGPHGAETILLRRLWDRLYAAAAQAVHEARQPAIQLAAQGGARGYVSSLVAPDPAPPAAPYGIPGALDLAGAGPEPAGYAHRSWTDDYPPPPGAAAAPPRTPGDVWPQAAAAPAPAPALAWGLGQGQDPAGQLWDELTRRVEGRAGRPRPALMDRALFALSMGRHGDALRDWLRAGAESADDLGHPLIAAYLHLMLGQYAESAAQADAAARRFGRVRPFGAANPEFALSIEGFRCYDPRPDRPFRAGEAAVVYLELVAPGFEPVGASLQVRFAIGVALCDAEGREVWAEPDFGRLTRRYRQPAREHNLALRNIQVPGGLRPGGYRLAITVHDLVKGETSVTSLPLEVVSAHAPAAAPATQPAPSPYLASQERPQAQEDLIRQLRADNEAMRADIQAMRAEIRQSSGGNNAALAAMLARNTGGFP